MLSPEYKLNGIFKSVQGEGVFTGVPATFVRFQGCNLDCSFCDTPLAKSHDGGTPFLPLEELTSRILKVAGATKLIIFTGGEPALQPITPLVVALQGKGYQVHLETNGTLPIFAGFDWIVLSPKQGVTYSPERIQAANEIKWLISTWVEVDALTTFVRKYSLHASQVSVQPISQGAVATQVAHAAAVQYGFRLSIQVHKYIGVE